MTQNKTDPPQQVWKKQLKPKSLPFATMAVLWLAISSAVTLGFAMLALIGHGITDFIKAGVITIAAGIVAYGVNRLAVERGAPLAAIGNQWAALVSAGSILIVGGGLATATYAGFVIEDVHDLRLQSHGQTLTELVDDRSRMATQAGRAQPVMAAAIEDLTTKNECEQQSSCLSGAGRGGVGPVSRALSEKLQRAESIAAQVEDGEETRAESIKELNRLLSQYQDTLSDSDIGRSDRRKILQSTHAEIGQQLSILDEAVPTALLIAYAAELQQPVEISGRRESSEKVSAVLAGHGASLDAVLQSVEQDSQSRPAFPGRTGVSDTFEYIGHFLPIGAIVAVVELGFPITLWLYTFFALSARVNRDDPPVDDEVPAQDSFAGLVTMTPVETAPPPVPARPRRNARRALNGGE